MPDERAVAMILTHLRAVLKDDVFTGEELTAAMAKLPWHKRERLQVAMDNARKQAAA